MPPPTGTAIVSRLIGKILDDIYELGKDIFSSQLAKLKNHNVRGTLIRRASACEKVKTLWQLDKEVRIPEFYYPSRITFNEGVTKEASTLKHFPRNFNFIIEGTIGQGKSIFLRYLCAQELRGNGTGRIPIFVELRLVDAISGLQGTVLQTLDEYGFEVTQDLWDFYANSGKFVLLLDAFDELPPECVSTVISELEHLSSKYPALQIIVTSRPDSDVQRSRHFRSFRLARLGQQDHKPFLKKLLINDADVTALLHAINASPARVASLLTTPLMLTLVAIVYRAEQAIPPELPHFFEMLFTTLFSRHDRTKAGFIRKRYSSLTEREIQNLFEAFCFMTRHHTMSTTLTDTQMDRALHDALKYSGIACDPNAFFDDITKIACLMQRDGIKTNFVHKSVQEFFAASFVRHGNDDFAKRFYESQRNTPRTWWQENNFLAQIDTYRYAKYFYIPEVATVESIFGISFSQTTPVVDERVLRLLTEAQKIVISVEDEYLASDVQIFYPPHAGPISRRIVHNVVWLAFDDIDGESGEDKDQILSLTHQVSDGKYEVALREYFDKRNITPELIEELNREFAQIKQHYDHFAGVISLEESKSGLFDGMSAPVTG